MELSKKRQIVNMKIFLVLFFVLIMATNVSAQEDVCIVYFTGEACGDDCRLTDSFIDGLINEYRENLLAIKYNIDLSQENKNIFEAYRTSYNLPSEVPLVLFGENDYISGMHNIFRNTEPRVYNLISANGTNCPLDSGYVPPSEVNPDMLPGEPEVYEGENGETPEDVTEDLEGADEKTNETPPVYLENIEKVFRGDQLFLVLLILVVVLTAVFLIILVKKR
jgi:hypothetical protein